MKRVQCVEHMQHGNVLCNVLCVTYKENAEGKVIYIRRCDLSMR